MRSRPALTAALAAAVALSGCGGSTETSAGSGEGRPIVLVSGRDDHGWLAEETVEILDGIDGESLGEVRDGTLVAVLGSQNEWLEVRSLEGPGVEGWVNDYYLRGTAHVVGPRPACPTPLVGVPDGGVLAELRASEQVELVDWHPLADEVWVGVRTIQGERLLGLVPRAWIRELPGPTAEPGTPCDAIELDPEAVPHRH